MRVVAIRSLGIAFFALIAASAFGAGDETYSLDCTVTVMARGGEITLPEVTVAVVPFETIRKYLEDRRQATAEAVQQLLADVDSLRTTLPAAEREFEAAHEAWVVATNSGQDVASAETRLVEAGRTAGTTDSLIRAAEAASNGEYPSEVPIPALAQDGGSTTPDAGGRFSLALHRGQQYVVVAWGHRREACTTLSYQWFVPLPAEGHPGGRLALTDDNVCVDARPEALLKLMD